MLRKKSDGACVQSQENHVPSRYLVILGLNEMKRVEPGAGLSPSMGRPGWACQREAGW